MNARGGAAAAAGRHCAVPLVTDVKRHSLEDGPGIRSVVFFKGCPLRCVFCQNPETQRPQAEVAFSEAECVRCGACERACRRGAIDMQSPGRIARSRCDGCLACAAACPGRGLRAIGRYLSPPALAALLLRDRAFYRHSGGGVTLSGGEPTLFPDFLEALLPRLRGDGVHVALQTCGDFEYDEFAARILPHLDLIFFDVKIVAPEAHRRHLGAGNGRILGNLRRLIREAAVPVHPRIPLVPGITDGLDNLSSAVRLLRSAGATDVALLPYNPLGLGMAARLGRPAPPLPATFVDPGAERALFQAFRGLLDEPAHGRPAEGEPRWVEPRTRPGQERQDERREHPP